MIELSLFPNIRNVYEFNRELAIQQKKLWHLINKSANQRSITIGYQLNGCLYDHQSHRMAYGKKKLGYINLLKNEKKIKNKKK